jgi:hypothetical protein
MFDRLSLVLESLARFIIPMGIFTVLAVAIILTLVVPPLGYYLVRFLSFAICCLVRFVGFVICRLVRFLGFVFSWHPKNLVGAPRNQLFPDLSAIPDFDANENRESQSACDRRNA